MNASVNKPSLKQNRSGGAITHRSIIYSDMKQSSRAFQWTLVLTLFLCSSLSKAAVVLITDDNSMGITIHPEILVESSSLTIEDIVKEEYQTQFQTDRSYPINLSFRDDTVWIKIEVQDKRTTAYENDLILELNNPLIDEIELYRPSETGFSVFKTGALEAYDQREIVGDIFLFYMPKAHGKPTTLYLKIRSVTPLILPFRIKSVNHGFALGTLSSHSSRILTGMLFLVISYNFLLAVTVREISQYYYFAWLTFGSVGSSFLMGVLQPYLGDNSILVTEKIWALGAFSCGFFLLHLSSYVKLHRVSTLLNRLNLLVATTLIINGLIIVATNYRLWQWTLFSCGILGMIAPIIICYCIYLKQPLAWLCVAVFSPAVIGMVTYILVSADMAPSNWFTLNSIFIGIISTGITIALTEGRKFRIERTRSMLLEQKNRKVLVDNNKLLTKTNAIKDSFLSTISHELRTPLNGISGALSLLEEAAEQTAKEEKFNLSKEIISLFNVANSSTLEMIGLINSIIGFSELQVEHAKITNHYFSAFTSIETLVCLHKTHIENNNNTVHLDIDVLASIEIKSDQEKFKKAVGIVIDNANKFTINGTIEIHACIDYLNTKQHRLCITITDTGVGISDSKIDAIAEPFSQVDQSFSREFGGLGIGLAVCKKTLDLLGGEFKITSEFGKGTSVQLTFFVAETKTVTPVIMKTPVIEKTSVIPNSSVMPNTQKQAPSDSSDTNSQTSHSKKPTANLTLTPETDLTGLHVLIVEDNTTNQVIIRKMVEKKGLHALLAENGAIAVELFQKNQIDMILMDCQMPVMNGFEATRQIRKLADPKQHLPIIAITANTSDEDQRNCKASGMDDLLSKPVSFKLLGATIEKWGNQGNHGGIVASNQG